LPGSSLSHAEFVNSRIVPGRAVSADWQRGMNVGWEGKGGKAVKEEQGREEGVWGLTETEPRQKCLEEAWPLGRLFLLQLGGGIGCLFVSLFLC
jgi:hypothetical protein